MQSRAVSFVSVLFVIVIVGRANCVELPVWGQAGGTSGQFDGIPSGIASGLKLSTPQLSDVTINARNGSYYDPLVLTDAKGNYIFSSEGIISVANYSANTVITNSTVGELKATFVNSNGMVFLGAPLSNPTPVNSSIFDPLTQTSSLLNGNVMILGKNDNFYIFVHEYNQICYLRSNLSKIWCAEALNANWALLSPVDGSLIIGVSTGIYQFNELNGTRIAWTAGENVAAQNIRFPAAINSNCQILTLSHSEKHIVLFDSYGELWRKNVTLYEDKNGISQFMIYSLPDNSFLIFSSTIYRINPEKEILWEVPWFAGVSLVESPAPQVIDNGSSLLLVRDQSANSSLKLLSKVDLEQEGAVIWNYTFSGVIAAVMALDNSSIVAFSTHNQSNVYTISDGNGICASSKDKGDCLDLDGCGWCSVSGTCEDTYCDPNAECCSAAWTGSQCTSTNVVTSTKGGEQCDPDGYHRRLIIGITTIVSVVVVIVIIATFVIYWTIEARKKKQNSYQSID